MDKKYLPFFIDNRPLQHSQVESIKAKGVPCAGLLYTFMLPPFASASLFDTTSLRPISFAFAVKSGWNSFPLFSGAIPLPVSVMRTSIKSLGFGSGDCGRTPPLSVDKHCHTYIIRTLKQNNNRGFPDSRGGNP